MKMQREIMNKPVQRIRFKKLGKRQGRKCSQDNVRLSKIKSNHLKEPQTRVASDEFQAKYRLFKRNAL